MRLGRLVAALLIGCVLFGLAYAVGPAVSRIFGDTGGATRKGGTKLVSLTPTDLGTAPGGGTVPGAGSSLLATRAGPETPYELLLRSHLPSGTFRLKPDDPRIIPYFANLAAMALVEDNPEVVREHIAWYFGHLNRPDSWGLDGSIYDHTVKRDGSEEPTGRYDSADAYAATLLSLLRAYVEKSGDLDFAVANLADIRRIGAVITTLQDSDGLVWAKANRREKYLMDNAENYRGLVDYAAVLSQLGLADEAAGARDSADRVKQGVEARLWNAERGTYDWAIYTLWLGGKRLGEISRPSGWKRWYPDTVAQVFPVVTGLLAPSDPRAAALYEDLNAAHPGWVDQSKPDPHPWSILGYAAAVMGDSDRARAFVRATEAAYVQEHGPYSGLSWELGYHLLTLSRLGRIDRRLPGHLPNFPVAHVEDGVGRIGQLGVV